MSTKDDWRGKAVIALIGVLGAILGALVGGWTNRMAAEATADRQESALHQHETEAARALAQILFVEFDHSLSRLCSVGQSRSYLRFPVPLRSELTEADRKLLAAHLDPAELYEVIDADLRLRDWERLYRLNVGKPAAVERDGLAEIVARAKQGRQAVAQFAGLTTPTHRKDLRLTTCDPRRWPHPHSKTQRVPSGTSPGGGGTSNPSNPTH